ncbi:MAG: 3,4-dihydroxy-2-butanone-4-phosphate synthase, partial [Vicinamibacterales bacterium]
MKQGFATVEEAIQQFQAGGMVIVVDDEDREHEGDLAIAADKVTPDAINFMAQYGRGLVCLSMTGQRLDELDIPMIVSENTSKFETAFAVPIDVKATTTTGISAADRAATIRAAIDQNAKPNDFAKPGHVSLLRARDGGVLVRAGQTEASVDLARLADLYPAAVICEIMNDDGTMARVPDLCKFVEHHKLPMITVEALIKYRMRHDRLVRRVASAKLPTEHGPFVVTAYESLI